MRAEKPLVDYVNPFLGTAAITNVADIGFTPPWRVWAGLTFPGAALPDAMVQLSPITQFGTGAGYQYEDPVIHAFAHSNKGHWNLCHIPVLPVSGDVNPDDFGSTFSHTNESAQPGYYQVFLQRYGINAELTVTLHCGYHKYTYPQGASEKLAVNLAVSNERVRKWHIEQAGEDAFEGFQFANERVYFYAVANHKIKNIHTLKGAKHDLPVVEFEKGNGPLEIKLALSYASAANARENLKELDGKSFEQVRQAASQTWEKLLSKIEVTGGTERQQRLFYSSLYRSLLWPALRSDVNGGYLDANGEAARGNFSYYAVPSLWDTYRNKLVLLEMLLPKVTGDVIQSLIDRGERTGTMPTFFHGDHAAAFIAGAYQRGLRNYDVTNAYKLLLHNATVPNHSRPFLDEYLQRGYVWELAVKNPQVESQGKAAVTKTLEYAYDDYAVALLARVLHDQTNYDLLMSRSHNFTNLFDPSTGLMRGRLENGDWVKNFNPQFPYYYYLYREANAWQSSFFAPQDTAGLIKLFPSKAAFEHQLDRLFSIPWNTNYIAWNINSFIGQYCHGNQPDHGFPYLYYFVGKQEKCQAILNEIMSRFYGMGGGNTLCGMDDAGEMSAWYVFNAIGLYTYSPADEDYIITVPMFDEVKLQMSNGKTVIIQRKGSGTKITGITYGGEKVDGYFISYHDLLKGKKLVISTGL